METGRADEEAENTSQGHFLGKDAVSHTLEPQFWEGDM